MSPEDPNHPIKNPALRALAHWYARRIVNVNVNIIAAGLIALVPVALAVYAIHKTGLVTNPWWITAITFVLDVIFDFSIYFALHYLANHGPLQKIVGCRSFTTRGLCRCSGRFSRRCCTCCGWGRRTICCTIRF